MNYIANAVIKSALLVALLAVALVFATIDPKTTLPLSEPTLGFPMEFGCNVDSDCASLQNGDAYRCLNGLCDLIS